MYLILPESEVLTKSYRLLIDGGVRDCEQGFDSAEPSYDGPRVYVSSITEMIRKKFPSNFVREALSSFNITFLGYIMWRDEVSPNLMYPTTARRKRFMCALHYHAEVHLIMVHAVYRLVKTYR